MQQGAEVGMSHRRDQALRHGDEKFFIEFEVVASQRVGVLVRQIEVLPQRDRYQNHHQLRRDAPDALVLDQRPAKQDRQADETDHRDFWIHIQNGLRHLGQQMQRLAGDAHHSQHDVNLFGHDDDADRRQHAVNGRAGKELAQKTQSKRAERNLNHTRREADRQRHLIRAHRGIRVITEDRFEVCDRAQHDHN